MRAMAAIARWAVVIACAAAAAGCSGMPEKRAFEYTRDMTYSLAYDSYAPNPVTRDGLTLQRLGDRP